MNTTLLWLLAIGPLALLAVGLVPAAAADRNARAMVRAARIVSSCASACGLMALLALGAVGPLQTGTLGFQGIGLGLYIDALSGVMFALVSFVGVVVVRFSGNYLDGDPGQGRFHGRLCLALAAVLGLIASGNLAFTFLCWLLVSVALHGLLVFYPQRPAALLAARKKFVTSRIGDLCLLAAMMLAWRQFGTLDYAGLFQAARHIDAAAIPAAVHAIAFLIATAALLKSAQFPTHGWLLEVMETPTPVSALLHAGIINAGGFLVLRFADIVALSAPSLGVLAIVGGFTALFGSAVMLTQTSVKVSLAYSTIAQMGFMMLECGLGAFPAAALHIVAHSLYKAHAFLSSGSVIDVVRASWTPDGAKSRSGLACGVALAGALAVAAVAAQAFGAGPLQNPGAFTLGAILALGLAHLALQSRGGGLYVAARVLGLALFVSAAYFALQAASAHLLASVLPRMAAPNGPFAVVVASLVILSFAALALFQMLLPGSAQGRVWRSLYTTVSNGFYVNTLANRWIIRFWPAGANAGVNLSKGAAK